MKTPLPRLLLSIALLLVVQFSFSQDTLKYVDAATLLMTGKAKNTDSIYRRVDSADAIGFTPAVKNLVKHSAGIAVLFETNSSVIKAKWKLPAEVYMHNMTPIAHSGMDLYCFKEGKWQYVSVAKPTKGTEQDQVIIQNMDGTMKQFMLYLPLYNGISDLQIGVHESAAINKPAQPGINTSKRIVVYGSSIVHGASASRSGMAYPAILQRRTGYDVINLGFSGNAKMEPEMAAYIASVQADCYVLDCIPNPSPEQIRSRAPYFIKYIREHQPNTPIVLVETLFRQNGLFDQQIGENVRKQNEEIKKAYEKLKQEGVKNIFYIESDKLIGDDHEATIDGVHLTDLGFMRIADAILPVIKKAMNEKK